MNKKLFTILFIAVFLIASVSFVSAAENIPVKVIWDDANHANERPNEITVNLICDGKVVDTAKLSASNSWKATFKNVDAAGSYKIQVANNPADYSIKTSGSAENGFVITAKIMGDALEASADETTVADEGGTNSSTDAANITNDENVTDDGSTEENATDDEILDNSTEENDTADDTPAPTDTQKTPVKDSSKPKETQKNKDPKKSPMKNTGIPIAGLVLVAFAAAFVPLSRKK